MRLYNNYKDIWHTPNTTGRTKLIKKKIKDRLRKLEVDYMQDNAGNVYIGNFEKERACLVAHMDSVHKLKSSRFKIVDKKLSSDNGIGGDDKCGIITILEVLKHNKNINAILTIDEECGGVGARQVPEDMLKNVKYFIEIDRRGNNEVIVESGFDEICSEEMQKDIQDIIAKNCFNFVLSNGGTYTDLNEIVPTAKKCGINLSAGYYNAHTNKEYVDLDDLGNIITFVRTLLLSLNKTYIYTPNEYKYYESYSDDYNTIDDITNEAVMFGYDEYAIHLIEEAYQLGLSEKYGYTRQGDLFNEEVSNMWE